MFVYMYYIYSIDINLGHDEKNFRLWFRFRFRFADAKLGVRFFSSIPLSSNSQLCSALLTGGSWGLQRSTSSSSSLTSVWRECSVLTETLRKLAKQVSNQANSVGVGNLATTTTKHATCTRRARERDYETSEESASSQQGCRVTESQAKCFAPK